MLRKLRHPAVAVVAALSLLVPLTGAAAEVCTASMEMENGAEPLVVSHEDRVPDAPDTAHTTDHASHAAEAPAPDGSPCGSDDCRSGAGECAVTACLTAPAVAGSAVADDPGPADEDRAVSSRILLPDAHQSILIPPPRR